MSHLPKLLLFFLTIPMAALTQTGDKPPAKPPAKPRDTAIPKPPAKPLDTVTVTGHTPPIQRKKDRTIINVEASPTNTGATVLEVLEKSPGVTVDRNGDISLNGKPGVLVMIDDKMSYLSGQDLNNLLSSMNAAEVAKIELIPNPPARYDATGSAGIINIKTKRSDRTGFNGSLTASYAQGVYPKTNNSLVLNYKSGQISTFFNYSINDVGYLTNLYAYRKYYDQNDNVTAILQQPAYFSGTVVNNTARTGLDYSPAKNTTIGLDLTGTNIQRHGNNTGHANWLDPAGNIDSSVLTTTTSDNSFKNGTINLHARRTLAKSTELRLDLDYLHYQLLGTQHYDNQLLEPGGYDSIFRSSIPATIDIYSGKLDVETPLGAKATLQTGLKISSSHTANAATYQDLESQQWVTDESRSNQFTYQENIQAAYASIEGKSHTISYQAGLRYEYTAYTISNIPHNYGSFFPNANLAGQIDSLNTLTLTVGRRIDRPPYQNLNPFLYIINKYTYATGNPYLLPQYSWNIDLTHQYADLLTTTLSYSLLTNYFSQIFLSDSTGTILFYTQGNVGTVNNIGAAENINLKPERWWTIQAGAVFNYKRFHGFNGNDYTSTISQLTINVNTQFTFPQNAARSTAARSGAAQSSAFTAELTAFYTTRAREDIQELQYPTGQVAAGISKPVLQKKGTIKLNFRDIFYTGSFSGLTSFPDASEYFKIKRDSRVVALSFTYHFGKSYKVTSHQGGATEEEERVQHN